LIALRRAGFQRTKRASFMSFSLQGRFLFRRFPRFLLVSKVGLCRKAFLFPERQSRWIILQVGGKCLDFRSRHAAKITDPFLQGKPVREGSHDVELWNLGEP
jgi:hypothetical protein